MYFWKHNNQSLLEGDRIYLKDCFLFIFILFISSIYFYENLDYFLYNYTNHNVILTKNSLFSESLECFNLDSFIESELKNLNRIDPNSNIFNKKSTNNYCLLNLCTFINIL